MTKILLLLMLLWTSLPATSREAYENIYKWMGICNERYCSYYRYGLRWSLSGIGEGIIWQYKRTEYIKISNVAMPQDKNIASSILEKIGLQFDPLKQARAYRFQYCSAATKTCTSIGKQDYYTSGQLEKLSVPMIETKRAMPIGERQRLVDRHNKLLVSAAGLAGSLYAMTLTLTGVIKSATDGLTKMAKWLYKGKIDADAKFLTPASGNPSRLNKVIPRVAGALGVVYFGVMLAKTWYPLRHTTKYYQSTFKTPYLMAIPGMLTDGYEDKVDIELVRDALDAFLRGGVAEFIKKRDTEEQSIEF